MTPDPSSGFTGGNGEHVRPGARIEYRFGARRGELLWAFNDGDCNVRFDDGEGPPIVKSVHLCKVPAWAEESVDVG